MILASLPVIEYNDKTMADIFHPFNLYTSNLLENYILQEYTIQGSPTPEMLSYLIYNSVDFYWLILYVNKIYDPFWGWIRSNEEIYRYADQKYAKVGGANAIAYYSDANQSRRFYHIVKNPNEENVWYDEGDENFLYPQYKGVLYPVTRYEHEQKENEKKRKIKILSPKDLNKFMNDLRQFLIDIKRK